MYELLIAVMLVALVLMCAFAIHTGIPGYDPRVSAKRPSATRQSPETAAGFGGKAYDSSVTYPMMQMKGPLPPVGSGAQDDEHKARREAEKAHQ